MINKIKYVITTETNPYQNLALEETLLTQVKDDEIILYLWQNEKTVVIGKNQNPWKECKTAELEADNGKLVRRLSGGGAVFHDLGNLNFTFLARKNNYNVEKQLNMILRAVNRLGIPAEKSGRNDITVEGRKFSGNAFYSDGIHLYHHGTILINVNMGMLSNYLNVSKLKLVSKGVESVHSRVTNLSEYRPDLDIEMMKKELIVALEREYGLKPEKLELNDVDWKEMSQLKEKYASWEWNYGRKIEFDYDINRRFHWGEVDLCFRIDSGRITYCKVYSDALETNLFEQLSKVLVGCTFSSSAMAEALHELELQSGFEGIIQDIIKLIREAQI